MTSKPVDKGLSMLNAADESVNPYGLILSAKEREFIYGELNIIDNVTNALLYGRTGWKQQAEAAFFTASELVGIGVAAIALHRFLDVPRTWTLIAGVAFAILQKLHLLLMHEKTGDTLARRDREREKEAKERAQYFKDMGSKDMSLEE